MALLAVLQNLIIALKLLNLVHLKVVGVQGD